MQRSFLGLMAAALSLAACSRAQNADCPAGTKRALGRCLTICAGDEDCLSSERCDPSQAICVARIGDEDASVADTSPSDAFTPDATQSDAGQNDAGVECGSFGEGECAQQPGCFEARCPTCPDGTSRFVVCVGPNDPIPDCAPPNCPACSGLLEGDCVNTQGCKPTYCPDCSGTQHFNLCIGENDPDVACPALICCNNITDEATCDATPFCHPVYYNEANCGCPTVGCCMRFSFCGDGAYATCQGMVTCRAAEPSCEGDYVVSYVGQCYEGCARRDDCGP